MNARAVTVRLAVAVLLALLGLLAGCAAKPAAGPGATPSGSPASPPPSAPPAAVTKLLVVVEENHSLDQMRAEMPYTFDLARRFGYATQYYAVAHPSLPNYLAITGGDTYGVTDDEPPSVHPLDGTSVFQQALDAHRTAGLYAESMPGNCLPADQGDYAVKHNPWAYFVRERQGCRAFDRPFGALSGAIAAGDLPNAGMVIPNLCHDAHDCDLSVADGWLRDLMAKVFAGPDWRSGHLAVVITADEDDHNQDNRVLTVVVHPSQRHHVVDRRLDHYSLTRLYEDVLHAPQLRRAARRAVHGRRLRAAGGLTGRTARGRLPGGGSGIKTA